MLENWKGIMHRQSISVTTLESAGGGGVNPSKPPPGPPLYRTRQGNPEYAQVVGPLSIRVMYNGTQNNTEVGTYRCP